MVKALDELIFLEERREHFGGDFPVEELFMDALHIEQVVDFLSDFRMRDRENTRKYALGIVQELCCDMPTIRKRQECLQYLSDNNSFGFLDNLFGRLLGTYEYLREADIFIRENADGFTEIVEIDPTRFNGLVKTYEGFLASLESFGEATRGSHFSEISDRIKEIDKGWFRDLKQQFPIPEDKPIHEDKDFRTYHKYEDLFGEMMGHLKGSLRRIIVTLDYFTGYARRIRRLREEGISLVFPEVVQLGGYRLCDIHGGVHPILYMGENASRDKVPNDFYSDELNPIKIITGENEYGKTMAIKTRAIIQVLAQAGLPVIAKSARLTPVSRILANIGLTEDTMAGKSTYRNINQTTFEILSQATPKSLLLLDEPTSGTYDLKAVAQARIYLEELARAGYEAWVVTHHLELTEFGDKYPHVQNLTTEVDGNGKPTHRIVPGVFVPNPYNVPLVYPEDVVIRAVKGDYLKRLERLKSDGHIHSGQGAALNKIFSSLAP